jgi:hypothetical protein
MMQRVSRRRDRLTARMLAAAQKAKELAQACFDLCLASQAQNRGCCCGPSAPTLELEDSGQVRGQQGQTPRVDLFEAIGLLFQRKGGWRCEGGPERGQIFSGKA